jgi:hypothetical protein
MHKTIDYYNKKKIRNNLKTSKKMKDLRFMKWNNYIN